MTNNIYSDLDPKIKDEIKHYWQVFNNLNKQYDSKKIKEIEFENKAKQQADKTMERILAIDDTLTRKEVFNLIRLAKNW